MSIGLSMKKNSIAGSFGALWGLAGVLALLSSATLRLWPKAVDAFYYPFAWYHWTALVAIVIGMAYAEGYKGFQKAFSPRTAARARYLRQHPRFGHIVMAPFFCMGYFHATKRRKITSISLTIGIIALIVLVVPGAAALAGNYRCRGRCRTSMGDRIIVGIQLSGHGTGTLSIFSRGA